MHFRPTGGPAEFTGVRITLKWEGVQGVETWQNEGEYLGLPVCIVACMCIFLSVHEV